MGTVGEACHSHAQLLNNPSCDQGGLIGSPIPPASVCFPSMSDPPRWTQASRRFVVSGLLRDDKQLLERFAAGACLCPSCSYHGQVCAHAHPGFHTVQGATS